MGKHDLASNNQQCLICHKTKLDQTFSSFSCHTEFVLVISLD